MAMKKNAGSAWVGTATFDESGRYRYSLRRTWDRRRPRVAFILLNPSTADAMRDDPTIRRCIGFARDWGFGSLEVVNIFAYRSTNPAVLRRVADPVGPENDRHILRAARGCARVVAAWGLHGQLAGRDAAVTRLLRSHPLHVLRLTKSGCPNHPLYLPATLRPVPWPMTKTRRRGFGAASPTAGIQTTQA